MQYIQSLIVIIHILAAAGVIGLVLMQHGKGADMGAAFGSGASGTFFGATGSANFLSRTTAVLAAVFFITSMSLTFLSNHKEAASAGLVDQLPGTSVPVKSENKPETKLENNANVTSDASKTDSNKSDATKVMPPSSSAQPKSADIPK